MPMTDAEYQATGGMACPNCRRHGTIRSVDDSESLHANVTCDVCGALWKDCYGLAGYECLQLPKPKRRGGVKIVKRGGRKAVAITLNGVTRTLSEWGHELGMSAATIRRRIRYGIKDAERLLAPKQSHNTMLTIKGVTKTIRGWADTCGLNYQTVFGRFKHGDSPERCIRPSQTSMLITRNGVAKTIKEWAEELGPSEDVVRMRKAQNWPQERWFLPLHSGRTANEPDE